MKKAVITTVKLAIIAVLVLAVALVSCLSSIYSYSYFNEDQRQNILLTYTEAAAGFYTDDASFESCIAEMNKAIDSLPANISALFRDEWIVIVSDSVPEDLLLSSFDQDAVGLPDTEVEVSGYTNWKLRTIYIHPQSTDEKSKIVFAHELGHFFDYEFGLPSKSQQFEAIYSAYENTLAEAGDFVGFTSNSQNIRGELFAHLFKEYLSDMEQFKQQYPSAVDFFTELYSEATSNPDVAYATKYDLQASWRILKENL